MRWLGLDWDEGPEVGGPHGPYFQSERLDRYREAAERLVASGHAYYCYCKPEELKAKRDAAEPAGAVVAVRPHVREPLRRRDRRGARRRRRRAPSASACRRAPPAYDDLVHGRIEFDNAVIEDFVVLRSDGHPTYHLSVVVDDIDMGITHVVRGDDHISNTPKQVLLYQALGAPVPRFAHVPLILGPDKRRLSKRHGATSVMEYERQGFLPEAMFNFLALLGWSPGNDRELFTRERAGRGLHARGHQREQRRLQPREARLVQQPAHRAARAATSSPTGSSRCCASAGLWDDAFAASGASGSTR